MRSRAFGTDLEGPTDDDRDDSWGTPPNVCKCKRSRQFLRKSFPFWGSLEDLFLNELSVVDAFSIEFAV